MSLLRIVNSAPCPTVFLAGTVDTKGDELNYLRDLLVADGLSVTVVDLSTRRPSSPKDISISNSEIARYHPHPEAVFQPDRSGAIAAMSEAFRRFVLSRNDISGILTIGGSGGSALVAAALQALPIGLPKVLVSTLASGDVSEYVGVADLHLVHPVTDIAGLNRVSRVVLGNAAHALAGMVLRPVRPGSEERPALGLTMYGVTTPCVRNIRSQLETEIDCIPFHATDKGGQALELLLETGLLSGFIDVTPSDLVDALFGGSFPAGPDRFGATSRSGKPYVGTLGALDMINFRTAILPEKFRSRRQVQHNAFITLIRTTPGENERVGGFIADKLNQCSGPVWLLIPEKGVSALDAPGQAFFDPEADAALFEAVESIFRTTDQHRLERLPFHINDEAFGRALAEAYLAIGT
jgi:uncharacterized protein (UPF0261 family)